MAHDEPQAGGPTKLVIRNIGLMLSGAMEKPILDADTIMAENGKITAIGRAKDIDAEERKWGALIRKLNLKVE